MNAVNLMDILCLRVSFWLPDFDNIHRILKQAANQTNHLKQEEKSKYLKVCLERINIKLVATV